MSVRYTTTCREVVRQLLSKYRLKHRDPNLFYLSLEVATRGSGQFALGWERLFGEGCVSFYGAGYKETTTELDAWLD